MLLRNEEAQLIMGISKHHQCLLKDQKIHGLHQYHRDEVNSSCWSRTLHTTEDQILQITTGPRQLTVWRFQTFQSTYSVGRGFELVYWFQHSTAIELHGHAIQLVAPGTSMCFKLDQPTLAVRFAGGRFLYASLSSFSSSNWLYARLWRRTPQIDCQRHHPAIWCF